MKSFCKNANLLTKDFIDFDTSSNKASDVSVADVVLVGLQIVIPLMNAEVLKVCAVLISDLAKILGRLNIL